MSGEERLEIPKSDEARAEAQGSRRIGTGAATGSPQHHHRYYQSPELMGDDSFSEERFVSTSSWEEGPSFDSEGQRSRATSRPSSRTTDRRKQFDTTTPTLIDEDDADDGDEEEMLELHRSFEEGREAEMHKAPGAITYKSTVDDLSQEDSLRRTPGAAAMHRSGNNTYGAVTEFYSQKSNKPMGSSVGLGFGLTLSTPVGSDDVVLSAAAANKQVNQSQQRISWESYDSTPPQRSQDETLRSSRGHLSSSPSSRQPGPKGPFPFTSWGTKSRREECSFSPNILRLTEDLGNLLHEDEDDDYALDIPIDFRGEANNESGDANYDWTGAYIYDTERRKKPAVPKRSLSGADKPSRRRGGNDRNQHLSDGLLSRAQQPKPRRNEVFEIGYASRTSNEQQVSAQPLIFGGAFAPPIAGPNRSFDRSEEATFHDPMAVAAANMARNQSIQGASSPFYPHVTQEMNRPRVASVPGHSQHGQQRQGSQIGIQHPGMQGLREHSHSFDSYQSAKQLPPQQVPTHIGGSYYHPDPYHAASPVYGIPPYVAHQSDMQASARVFVPQGNRSGTPNYHPSQQQQQQQQQHWSRQAQPYDMPVDQQNWQPASNYGYITPTYPLVIQPQQSFGDPRSGATPSPILQSWQQQQTVVQGSEQHMGMYTGGIQHHQNTEGTVTTQRPVPSPVPSTGAASDQATQSSQRVHKKDTKRKQRGKKKSQKIETSSGGGKKVGGSGIKKKGRVEMSRSGTRAIESNEETHASASEDPACVKRSELVESPATRIAFKEFYRAFRGEERISFQRAEKFAVKAIENETLPESIHWRVFLELADLAKRANRYVEARCLYQKVCQLQPYASQGWLEYSKLEEECGNMNRVMNILHKGLNYCEFNENLLTRAVKHQEKMGKLENARGLLARLKRVGIEKVWRTVLEGALLEARAGNFVTARRVLKYLMHHVPWYGPLYLEAYRLEKDQGRSDDALDVVERGLDAIPRYGPLWFGAFRLCEEMDLAEHHYHLPRSMKMLERAAVSISKELVWKVHLEAAQMLERAVSEIDVSDEKIAHELLSLARKRLSMTILTCPNNLRWKVWLAAARMELGCGNAERARLIFLRAHEVVPAKGRSSTLLECARLEDFVGDTDLARAILCKGRAEYGNDWKVWLEGVLLEVRSGNFLKAMEICDKALDIHQGTGRLWATLVQLRQYNGRDRAQLVALRRALNAVPKSGEVWCEGGRIHLNPFSATFDLDRARRHLFFATRFTPQYGDGFVETVRLEIVRQWLQPVALYIWKETQHTLKSGKDTAIEDCLTKYITDVSLAISIASQNDVVVSTKDLPNIVHKDIVTYVRKQLRAEAQSAAINLNEVRLACVNADPNYGLLWFHCRQKATDTPRRIIEDAAGIIAKEVHSYARLYLAAMIRREAILSLVDVKKPESADKQLETSDPDTITWENIIDERLHGAPTLEEIFNPRDPTTGMVLMETTVGGPHFATGVTELNRHESVHTMSLRNRRTALFGNDALFP